MCCKSASINMIVRNFQGLSPFPYSALHLLSFPIFSHEAYLTYQCFYHPIWAKYTFTHSMCSVWKCRQRTSFLWLCHYFSLFVYFYFYCRWSSRLSPRYFSSFKNWHNLLSSQFCSVISRFNTFSHILFLKLLMHLILICYWWVSLLKIFSIVF